MGETYQSWAAIATAIKTTAKTDTSGRSLNELLATAMFDRLLSRVFNDGPESGWLLKGGTSMLARIPTARHTSDIDLATNTGTLDEASETLAEAAARDIGDHLTFHISDTHAAGKGQPGVEVRRLILTATETGRPKLIAHVPIDLVISTAPVGYIHTINPANRLHLPKPLPVSPYRLYPMVDHIADKVCATMTTFPGGRPSSRVKDLVDLALIARTQTVDLDQLRLAITTKRMLSRLDEFTHFTIPDGWETKYHLLSSKVPDLAGTHITHAVTLVTAMIDPALVNPGPAGPAHSWCPDQGWTETTPDAAHTQGVDFATLKAHDGRTVHVRTHTRHGILVRDHHRSPRQ